MSPFVRFAPSPTGYLHVGNVRTALVNWLFARKNGGRFLLRLDDTDVARSREEYAKAIEEDLRWLGLTWDDYAKQSDRFAAYKAATEKLMAAGRLYACYETQEELDIKRKLQAGRGLPPVYDRASLSLSDADKDRFAAEDRKPHYRFLLEGKPILWQDMIRGEVRFDGGHVSDPVLVREDGVPLYTLASVVDDGDMGITHIVRGEDHVSNTAVQVQIFEALGFTPPVFGHLALLKTKEGELSKRVGGNDIRSLRESGIDPIVICSLLAKIGTSDAITAVPDLATLVAQFDIVKFGRAPATYDVQDLLRLNEKFLAQQPFNAVVGFLQDLEPLSEAFWDYVRGNISTYSDAAPWHAIVHHEDFSFSVSDEKEFLTQAAGLLPTEPWDGETWSRWTEALKTATGRKGKALFMPLRLAITGREDGPELKKLLPLLGYATLKARLENACR